MHGEVPDVERMEAARAAVSRILWWQGRKRFTAKFTGPPRIDVLHACFPGATFVHVTRDPRAIVASLFDVDFWQARGLDGPYWEDGFSSEDRRAWEAAGRSPAVLAALQWRRVILTARAEANRTAARLVEVRYEAFLRDPAAELGEVFRVAALSSDADLGNAIERAQIRQDRNERFRERLSPQDIAAIEAIAEEIDFTLA